MSEQLNNQRYRKEKIKEIITMLHDGKDFELARELFEKTFEGVTAKEISDAEQALIAEGMPVAEVQRLCDVHASVFKGSIEEIHETRDLTNVPGHPAQMLVEENKVITRLIDEDIASAWAQYAGSGDASGLSSAIKDLARIDIHYQKKENIFFSYMEKHGITAPPQVMWGVDDEVRAKLKEVLVLLAESPAKTSLVKEKLNDLTHQIKEMIFKEENIMMPMLVENMTSDEWRMAYHDAQEFGTLLGKEPSWAQADQAFAKDDLGQAKLQDDGHINLATGRFNVDELNALFNTLPIDITFVDAHDRVKFFSQTKDRPFPRTKAILGREVSNCHPPASVHIVEAIVEDFKKGKKDQEDFWLRINDQYVLIRYYALRDEEGTYLGVVEVTQDINPIQAIEGEKRLVE